MDKVKFSNIERKRNSKTEKGILLIVTYHPPEADVGLQRWSHELLSQSAPPWMLQQP